MKNPLLKAGATVLRAANNGQIKLVDMLAGELESLDLSKIKNLTAAKKKKINDSKKVIEDIKVQNKKLLDEKNKVNSLLMYYESSLIAIDEFVITVSIMNDTTAFGSSIIYQTPNELVKQFNLSKKKYASLNQSITDYQKVKTDYTKYITNVKKMETNLIQSLKTCNELSNKLNQLNSSIDKIKKE